MIATTENKKLTAAIQRQEAAQKELVKWQATVHRLLIDSHVEIDASHQRLVQRETDLRKTLHRHRLRMSQKRRSVKCQESRLAKTRTALSEQETEENSLVRAFDQIHAEQERIRIRVAETALADLEKTDLLPVNR